MGKTKKITSPPPQPTEILDEGEEQKFPGSKPKYVPKTKKPSQPEYPLGPKSHDRAFRTGWSVVKGKLQCNGREHIQLVRDEKGNLKTDCECDKGCLPTKMTRA